MGELTDWLTQEAKISREKIITCASDKSAEGKRFWYLLTREAFVRSVLKDYGSAKDVSAEDIRRRKTELFQKYSITGLETWKELGHKSPEPIRVVSATAKSMMTKAVQSQAAEKRQAEREILDAHVDVLEAEKSSWRATFPAEGTPATATAWP